MLKQTTIVPSVLAALGLKDALISPGSRNAPLTIGFNRHPDIKTYVISDERSAAFIGFGMSKAYNKPAALICTSGSAGLNYSPAIAEAFYQKTPLLVLTADRPPEWINQQDGQTINQPGMYGNFIKKSYSLPVSLDHPDDEWMARRVLSEAYNTATSFPEGPVHINIPFREPFYPDEEPVFQKEAAISRITGSRSLSPQQASDLSRILSGYKKVLLIAGQQDPDKSFTETVARWCAENSVPLVADSISNFSDNQPVISHHDLFLKNPPSCLSPDLVISFGESFISKNLKLFLRKAQPAHWIINESPAPPDLFKSLTTIISTSPQDFFLRVKPELKQKEFHKEWNICNEKAEQYISDFLFPKDNYSETEAVKTFAEMLPDNCYLHLSNSMPVRYFNLFGLQAKKNVRVFANRGTSGIDGVVSTAVGTALKTNKPVYLLTGDMAFFYDRNAFWNSHIPDNLRIFILNNSGGVIFRMIEGPKGQPELEKFFQTDQFLKAESLANEFSIPYFAATDRKSTLDGLSFLFSESTGARLLELKSSAENNEEIFKNFIKNYKNE